MLPPPGKHGEVLRDSEFHQELGQKMCAAFIAQQQGIALNTAFKKTSQSIGDFWLVVAEFATRGLHENVEAEVFGDMTAEPQKFVV